MVLLPLRSIDPLNHNVRIVDAEGKPTPQFLRQWVQARTVNLNVEDVVVSVDELRSLIETAQSLIAENQALLSAVEAAVTVLEGRNINAGTGLDGGGDLSTDVTLDLADTTVTPGTYGSATHVAQITVDQQGRITAVTEVEIV